MWNNGGGFMDRAQAGGEFVDSPSQFSSPAAQKERKSQNPIPLTIKMINDSQGDSVMVAGSEAQMIVVVGVIRSVDVASTKITYTIDDSTGSIQAVRWLESDSGYDEERQQGLVEKIYCKVVGTLRTQMEVKHIMIVSIEPILDMNRVTTHILEVIHTPLKLKEIQNLGENAGQMAANSTMASHSTTSMNPNSSDGGNMQGLTGPARLVYQLVKMAIGEIGTDKGSIRDALAGKVAPNAIDTILDQLSGEGLIFCTIDDEHFKTSDNY